MPASDALRWDARYREDSRYASFERPRLFLVEHVNLLLEHGLALDAAMGLGGNAGFLIARGMRVIGVDISGLAVQRAKARHPAIMAVQADLTQFYLPPATFDVILNFYYLQRDLWPRYLQSLRPGGVLIFETLTIAMHSCHPEIEPEYLLKPGELQQAFSTLKIIDYREGWTKSAAGHPRAVACLAARSP